MNIKKYTRLFSYLVPFITVMFGFYVVKNLWVAMLGYHFLAVAILSIQKQGYRLKQLFVGGSPAAIILSVILAAISGVVLFISNQVMNVPLNLGTMLETLGLAQDNWLLFILYYSFVNPIIEEVYWRGYLGSETGKLTLSDLCYAGYHPLVLFMFVDWPWVIVEFAILLGVAWMWRMLIRKYNGLLLPVLMHFAADLSIAMAIYFLAG